MHVRSSILAPGATVLIALATMALPAQAQDFFSNFFGMFNSQRAQPSMTPLPFASEGRIGIVPENSAPRPRYSYAGSQAYCVRTCDGRYFPITGTNRESRAAACNSFCPASKTEVVYGGTIDSAVTENGKPYSGLPNAFRYRDELVAGCTCNGKDPVGLAAVKLEDDPTLRRGDIVAEPNGLMVAARGAERRGAALALSPAPESVRAHYRRVPVVAAQ
jgi:hypothetical protein